LAHGRRPADSQDGQVVVYTLGWNDRLTDAMYKMEHILAWISQYTP
jgi:hypothetical protein